MRAVGAPAPGPRARFPVAGGAAGAIPEPGARFVERGVERGTDDFLLRQRAEHPAAGGEAGAAAPGERFYSTNSMRAIGAPSPARGPSFRMRV